jgi:glutathione S-transferase
VIGAALKFYMTPGSCSTGIHILLEEVGLIFEAHIVNLVKGDHLKSDYLAINPHGTIPTLLLDDGVALTDFVSIARWLAENYPKRRLLPQDDAAREEALKWMNFCVGRIHGDGFRRIFTPERYAEPSLSVEAIKSEGREIVMNALATADRHLSGKDYIVGDFSIADAALFYVEFWADKTDMPLPENCRAHYARMKTRPSVRQVLAEEGYRV